MSVFDILIKYYPAFFKGLSVTLQLCAVIWASGLVLGAALGLAGSRFKLAVGLPSQGFSFLLSGIPLLVFSCILKFYFSVLKTEGLGPTTIFAALSHCS